jgi:hypothetical protein
MDALPELIAVLIGFLVRLGIPIGLTALLTWLLRRLDARWQREAQARAREAAPSRLAGPGGVAGLDGRRPCWEVRHCPAERRVSCPAYLHPELPCWQIFRTPAGQLQETCLGCPVFRGAPLPLAT